MFFKNIRKEKKMKMPSNGEMIAIQTEKAVKYAIISEIRKDIGQGYSQDLEAYLNGLIINIEKLKI